MNSTAIHKPYPTDHNNSYVSNTDSIIERKFSVRNDSKHEYMILRWDHTVFNEAIEVLIRAIDELDEPRSTGAA